MIGLFAKLNLLSLKLFLVSAIPFLKLFKLSEILFDSKEITFKFVFYAIPFPNSKKFNDPKLHLSNIKFFNVLFLATPALNSSNHSYLKALSLTFIVYI